MNFHKAFSTISLFEVLERLLVYHYRIWRTYIHQSLGQSVFNNFLHSEVIAANSFYFFVIKIPRVFFYMNPYSFFIFSLFSLRDLTQRGRWSEQYSVALSH